MSKYSAATPHEGDSGRMTTQAGTLTYPPRGSVPRRIGRDTPPARSGLPAGTEVFSADDHISLSEDIFWERFPDGAEGAGAAGRLRGRRVDAGHRRAGLPPARVHGCADAVRPPRRLEHRRHRRPPGRARVRRHPPRAGVPERAARPHGLARQGRPRALLPHLQRAHRRAAGRIGRPVLRRRDDQLVGRRRGPTHARRAEGPRPQDVLAAAEAGQGRRRQAHRLQLARHVPRVGGDRGERPPRGPPHRRVAPRVAVRGQQRAHRHGAQRGAVPRDVRALRVRRDPRPPPRPAGRLVRGRHQLGPRRAPGRRAPLRVAAAHGRPPDRAQPRRTTGAPTCTPRSWSTRSGSR